jgi:hypothetical protein
MQPDMKKHSSCLSPLEGVGLSAVVCILMASKTGPSVKRTRTGLTGIEEITGKSLFPHYGASLRPPSRGRATLLPMKRQEPHIGSSRCHRPRVIQLSISTAQPLKNVATENKETGGVNFNSFLLFLVIAICGWVGHTTHKSAVDIAEVRVQVADIAGRVSGHDRDIIQLRTQIAAVELELAKLKR